MEEKEELEKQQGEKKQEGNVESYLQALAKQKEQFDSKISQLEEEKSKLIDAVLNKSILSGEEDNGQKNTPLDIDECRKDYVQAIEKRLPNVEIMRRSLKLREAALQSGLDDPYLPIGRENVITNSDREEAENTANQFKELVDIYDEKGQLAFDQEYMNRMGGSLKRQ